MKRSISTLTQYLIIISLFLSSCNHFKGYEISGKIKNAEGVKVYLEDITETVPVVIDTTTILQSAFELKNYSTKGIYRLRFGEDGKNSIFLYIQEKDRIKVEADLKDLSDYKVDGSKGSFSIQQLSATSKMRIEALDSMYSRLKSAGSESRDSLMTVFAGRKRIR